MPVNTIDQLEDLHQAVGIIQMVHAKLTNIESYRDAGLPERLAWVRMRLVEAADEKGLIYGPEDIKAEETPEGQVEAKGKRFSPAAKRRMQMQSKKKKGPKKYICCTKPKRGRKGKFFSSCKFQRGGKIKTRLQMWGKNKPRAMMLAPAKGKKRKRVPTC